jgi:fumarate reductase flavoprotein subunit
MGDRFRLLVERPDSPIRRIDLADPPFGIPADELRRTLDDYAAAASGAHPDGFGRVDVGWAPFEGDLYAARAEASVLTTLGGLVVGDHGEVLDSSGAPIRGLYAAGGTAQTLSGTVGAGGYISGTGLLAALGYGRLAGDAAARL